MRFFDELSYIKYKLGIGKILIAIILIYILVIVSNSFLVHFTIKSISNDAALINSSGKIRGGIQRAVKLTLQDRYSNDNILIIDKIFKDFLNSYEKSTSKDIMKDFYIKLKELEYSWSDLKILLSAYDKNKTFDLKEKILYKSEETWVLSMETLDTAQKLYDEKIGSFLSIFIIFTINLFFGFIIIYIVNKSVSNYKSVSSSRSSSIFLSTSFTFIGSASDETSGLETSTESSELVFLPGFVNLGV